MNALYLIPLLCFIALLVISPGLAIGAALVVTFGGLAGVWLLEKMNGKR